jgi:acetylornithine deacetylase
MLNSHIDTVLPSEGYTRDPFDAGNDYSVVSGLGSNDAGASVVSMLEAFLFFSSAELPYRIMLLLSAQEENSGSEGISLALKSCPKVDAAVVGEPTRMKAAIAERGLLVIDAVAHGESGHAARDEGVNALYVAIEDIEKLRRYRFDRKSDLMGEVRMTVTAIRGGNLHNVVPDKCSFTIDIRPTECYSNQEITTMLQREVKSILCPRNLNNKCSLTPPGSSLIKALERAEFDTYVSPTTSDWMRLNCPAIKMGPGDSSRSHRPDEFVTRDEIMSGIDGYIRFVNNFKF